MTTSKMTTSTTAPNPATHTAQPACSACGHQGASELERYELAMEWLSAHGWRTAGPVCPDCLADIAR